MNIFRILLPKSLRLRIRRLFTRVKGKGTVYFRARIEGVRSNIQIDEGALVREHAWLSCPKPESRLTVGRFSCIQPYAQLFTEEGFIRIGSHCSVNSFCILNGAGGLTIGDKVRIGSHTVIVAGNHGIDDPGRDLFEQMHDASRKGVQIQDDVWIGTSVVILDGVKIGSHSVIAAGAVVTKDVPENSIVAGVPAKVLRRRGPS